jgi:hypothetical protein
VLEERHGAVIRKHTGAAFPDDREYLVSLMEDIDLIRSRTEIVVYDRAWASEVVYGTLLGEPRRLGDDSWLAEWLYGRAVQTHGVRAMILGPDDATLDELRDASDLPVSVGDERVYFAATGHAHDYTVIYNKHSREYVVEMAHQLVVTASLRARKADELGVRVPFWCGPTDARVVIVGTKNIDRTPALGKWLPFSSAGPKLFSGILGPAALKCAWAYAEEVPSKALLNRELIVTVGSHALAIVQMIVLPHNRVILSIPNLDLIPTSDAPTHTRLAVEEALHNVMTTVVRKVNLR